MKLNRTIAAIAAGILAISVYEFIVHGLIFVSTYRAYPEVFRQDPDNMVWFPIVTIAVGIAAGLFFAKTRSIWSNGAKGGMTFGFWLGLVLFADKLYIPLNFEGFPYYLTWCWAVAVLIEWVVFGAVVGMVYKRMASENRYPGDARAEVA